LLYLVTHALSARHLLKGQLAWLRQRGFEVAVAANPDADLYTVAERERVEVFAIPMEREIAPLADMRSLVSLFQLIRRWRPHIVNASTPKAGLLGMMAARMARVPVRVYVLRGLRLESSRGWKRTLLAGTERIAAACSDCVIAVSESLAREYTGLGLAPASKVMVLGTGSSNGVDCERIRRGEQILAAAEQLRQKIQLPPEVPVIGFVGRLGREKGIAELMAAYRALRREFSSLHLLLVGAVEAKGDVEERVLAEIKRDPQILSTGWVDDTAPAYALMDVLALPTYREGFPNAVLEANAMERPVVASRVTGCIDAVVDGVTGLLVPARDAVALAEALGRYLASPELRAAHGRAARARAERDFRPESVWQAVYEQYVRLLKARGLPVPPTRCTDASEFAAKESECEPAG
jgi:glycosyltransferase involved in cell wall biosynthesis